MDETIKISVVMELLNKEIAKTNSILANNSNELSQNKLNYLLNFKKNILSGNLSGIDEFLKKYKENNL